MKTFAGNKLVVNADDYGMTRSISKGILKAHANGIVTSVSIVTNTPSFKEAISWVNDIEIDKGIHLTLNSGKPLSPPLEFLSILNNRSEFYLSPIRTPFFYFICKRPWKTWVHAEFRRQIEKLLTVNIKISHLDSHFHIHVFPGITDVISEIVKEYDIPYVRKPCERLLKKKIMYPAQNLISFLSQKNIPSVGRKSLPFYGLTEAGRVNSSTLIRILKSIETKTGELMLHPGYNSEENMDYYPAQINHFEEELKAAVHPDVHDLLRERNITLTRRSQLDD
jgi:chitin disaccharide deacetylase